MSNDIEINELHSLAHKQFLEAYQLVFQALPQTLKQIIEQEIWREKNCKNFGEYALQNSPHGLNVSNNHKLWLLKSAMDIHGEHAVEWGDVLNEVDHSVRSYAKEKKIQIKELSKNLDRNSERVEEQQHEIDDTITYLPSRSKSNDSQLLKLRQKDQETYNKVIKGEMSLKEAFRPAPRKQVEPIESVKNKFNNLSNEERVAFIAWIEQQKHQI